MPTYLSFKHTRSSIYPFFRCVIPLDLRAHFNGTTKFELSLKSATTRQSRLLGHQLRQISDELFEEIRGGMRDLTLEDIKEILRFEVRKQIRYAHHVDLGTNQYDLLKKTKSLKQVTAQEEQYLEKITAHEKEHHKELDVKLGGILDSLGIEVQQKSLEYKQLRRHFTDLHLLKYEWTRSLISKLGKSDDDFRREAGEKLGVDLFPELSAAEVVAPDAPVAQQPQAVISEQKRAVTEPSQLNSLQSKTLSESIAAYLDEKNYSNVLTKRAMTSILNLMIEDFGNIPIGRVDKEKANLFKAHLRKMPRNRMKMPEYREKSYHELVGKEIPAEKLITVSTVNNQLSKISSFMDWCQRNGYSDTNPFAGMKVQVEKRVRASQQRDRYTEQEIKKLFDPKEYLPRTNPSKKHYAFYWVPLIGLFTGARLNEICSLYLDNVRPITGKSGQALWCFDILEEEHRPQKRLKNLASRRIIPVHDTLIELGFIDLVEMLQKQGKERLFEELTYSHGNFGRSMSRFWNERYLKHLGVKNSKLNFHSFRHTVADTLKQVGVEPHFINELLGHSQENIDLDRYGKAYNPEVLYEKCMKYLVYETSRGRRIDFRGLKVKWGNIV
jgi:integrase